MTHSVIKVSNNLNSILSSGKKRISFLFGAGTSMYLGDDLKEYNIPGVDKLTDTMLANLDVKFKDTVEAIKNEKFSIFNVETLLTNLNMRIEVVGAETLNGLNKELLLELKKDIIIEMIKILKKHLNIYIEKKDNLLPHIRLCNWLKDTQREFPVEIFTTNYDMLIEMALECKKIKFSDGFYGSLHPFFDSSSTTLNSKDDCVKLWKIHGSLGWIESHNGVVKSAEGENLMVLPSILKYRDSRKEPYTFFLDRLASFIKTDDCVLVTSGYSFNDQHINEVIVDSLNSSKNSLVIGLVFDETSDKKYRLDIDCNLRKLALENKRLWLFGKKSAIIDGNYGEYDYSNISKDNLEMTSNIFESDYIEGENKDDNRVVSAELKIVDSTSLFMFLESMRLEQKNEKQ